MNISTTMKITSLFSSHPHLVKRFQSDNTENLTSGTSKKHKKITKCSRTDLNKHCFASGINAKYMEYLFSKWMNDEHSVHMSRQKYFKDIFLDNNNGHSHTKSTSGAVSDIIHLKEDKNQHSAARTEALNANEKNNPIP